MAAPVELLAPAGSPEALDAAIAEGADAVYLGLKSFNARMRSANFAYSQFEGALRALHRMGRKVYVTVNTVFEEREADRMYQLLNYLAAVGPDGIIVQDFGVLLMAREFRSLKIHASTQMNIASARGVNVLSKHGVSRVVLARELSLEEIRTISHNTSAELEVFVHGALCVSASGLCLFSSYLGGKSANRGLCTQACRRLYVPEEDAGRCGADGEFTMPRRGGSVKPAGFGAKGEASPFKSAYYFSPCDLSLVGRVGELAGAGVRAFKIEGRMKSAEYVGTVVSAYRRVIDSLGGGEDEQRIAVEEAGRILQNDFARSKTEFFFAGRGTGTEDGAWLRPLQDGGTGIRLGTVVKVKGVGTERQALVKGEAGFVRGRNGGSRGSLLSPGDSVRFHRADDSRRQAHKLSAAETLEEAAGTVYRISIPEGFDLGDSVYLIQTRAMTKRYPQVIPRDISVFRRQPGREKAPKLPDTALLSKVEKPARRGGRRKSSVARQGSLLPEGLFVSVASVEDLYMVQSVRPAGVILPVNRKMVGTILEDKTLPFGAGDIIPALDPFFPQEDDAFLTEAIEALKERGCGAFIVNSPGHFSLFRGRGTKRNNPADAERSGVHLIAGPWLYTFNGWAAAFVRSLGAGAFVTPLENNRQNLEKTIPLRLRSSVFVTLFAWPSLFRIRDNLEARYGFKHFDGHGGFANGNAGVSRKHIPGENDPRERFSLIGGENSTTVIPAMPFCITDKRPFLETAGFRRFILDFSGGTFKGSFPLKKKLYKEVMKAAAEVLPLPGISRFNWKDGFWSKIGKDADS